METLDVARKYLGIKEYGKNQGFSLQTEDQRGFEQSMRKMGWRPGMAWCAFFIKLCVQESLGTKYSHEMNGSVHQTFNRLLELKLFKKKTLNYQKGDLVFWDAGEKRGHCGIVASTYPSQLVTIEGNTNKAGSREGDGVHTKQRSIQGTAKWTLLGFLSPINNKPIPHLDITAKNEDNSASV